MIEHQRMAFAATGGGQQYRGVDQCIEVDQVEQVLEQARVGTAINRRGDNQQIGLFDGLQFGFDVGASSWRDSAAPNGRAMSPSSINWLSIGSCSASSPTALGSAPGCGRDARCRRRRQRLSMDAT
jgi:hypothetical protein